MRAVFGPVASRRLGLSLGIDLVPHKTCNFNCIYCECGPTTNLMAGPGPLRPASEILPEVAQVLTEQEERLDYITLSGAGEPTLNSDLSAIVEGLKGLTDTPLAVLTNSTLLHRPEVTAALEPVDLIMPSLDTAIDSTFQEINRPHPAVKLENILTGLYGLKRKLKADVWLEILLVAGFNDSPQEVEALVEAVGAIDPDRVQLNTVDRPPPEPGILPVAFERLEEIASLFGAKGEVIARPLSLFKPAAHKALAEDVLSLIDRRPCTRQDLKVALGRSDDEIAAVLKVLMVKGRVRQERLGDNVFLRGIIEKG
ncbi:MAG: radical SAM protein [Deltaproteobacteria bacterium]|nr:radical SAM protein [Deltaproteobacteria bacterium]